MPKETIKDFYFNHDQNASNDDRILAIREKYGWEGIGIFWAILETMSRNDGYVLFTLIGGISIGYGIKKEYLSEFLEFAYCVKLFKKDKQGYYSERMIRQLNYRKECSEFGKKGAEIRWGNNSHPNSQNIATPIAQEKRREEKRIQEERIQENNSLNYSNNSKVKKETLEKIKKDVADKFDWNNKI